MLLKLYDLGHTLVGGLKNHKDAKVESELSTGDKTLSFLWHSRNKLKVSNEYYIRTDTDEFVVKENSKGTNGYRNITAKLNLEDIEAKVWRTFTASECTAQEMADLALANTGWTCVSTVPKKKLRNVTLVKVNSYQVFEKIQEAFICEVQWDTLNKIVYLKEHIGEDRGAYFISGLNLKELSDSSDTYDFATEIIPFGADDLDITSVNNGSNYLSNYQYSKKKITVIWEDSNYTDPQALMEDAEYRLNEMSKPKKTQQAKIIDLAKLKPEYEILTYSVGDTVTLIDDESGIREKQRITKTVEYLESPEKNTCDISNTVLSFEEMQKKLFAAADCISNITSSNGTVKGSSVDKINISQIIGIEEYLTGDLTDLKSDYIYARKELGAVYAAIGEADFTTVNTNNLMVNTRADMELAYITESYTAKAYGDYAKFKVVEAENISALAAKVEEFASSEITTEYLKANYTTTEELKTKYATIDLSNVKVESVQELFVNVGLIKDATIVEGHITGYLDAVSINAESIKAGTLSVDRLVLNGTEDSLIFALNNIGELTSTHCDTLDGGLITERTVTAEHIVTGAVTANEIASGTITADKINVADLFAQSIKATGSITGLELYSTYIETTSGKIGGFTINDNAIYNGTTDFDSAVTGMYIGADGTGNTGIKTVSEDGYVIHAAYYSNYYYNDEKRSTTLSGGGIGLYTTTSSNTEYPSDITFYKNDVRKGFIDCYGIQDSNQDYYFLFDGDASIKTLITAGGIYEGGTALSSKYAAKSHTHSYLPLSGGDLTGNLTTTKNILIGDRKDGTGNTGINLSPNGVIHLSRRASEGRPYISLFYDNATDATSQWMGIGASCSYFTNYVNFGDSTAQTTHRIKANGSIYASGNIYEGGTALSSKYQAKGNYLSKTGGTLTGNLTMSGSILVLKYSDEASYIRTASTTMLINNTNSSGTIALAASGGITCSNKSNDGYVSITAKTFTQASSKKVKENIVPITEDEAKKILDVDVVSFDYKKNFGGTKEQIGVIAEWTQHVIPNAVIIPANYSEDDFDEAKGINQPIPGVDYTKFVPYLIKMVQMQQKEIEQLKKSARKQ